MTKGDSTLAVAAGVIPGLGPGNATIDRDTINRNRPLAIRLTPMHRVALFLVLATLSGASAAQYEVRRDPDSRSLRLRLALPSTPEEPVKLALRGTAWGLRPQVSDVRCETGPLRSDPDGTWNAPAGCRVVTWRVVADVVSAEGADASEQRTLAVGQKRWFLLAEPTSLLRPMGLTGAMTIRAPRHAERLMGATTIKANVYRVPPFDSAPEFYALGRFDSSRRMLGRLDVTDIADDAATVARLGLRAAHARALRYLSRVVPPPRSIRAMDRSLLVVWLGIAESRRASGGAAGSRSFVANYLVGSSEHQARNAALTSTILSHEQFHQLVDLSRSQLPAHSTAVWLDESLAQYYALKALSASDKSSAARAVRAEFIDLERPVEQGLLEWNRRNASGDHAAYDSFYSEGATLWFAIDTAIATATHGGESLDDFLGEILGAQVADDGSLPSAVVDRLCGAGGAGVERAWSRYVGR